MRDVEIRMLTSDDTDAFLRLKQVGLSSDPLSFVASLDEDPPDYRAQVAARLARGSVEAGDVILGAFAPELVGIISVTRDPHAKRHHKADLHGMYVRPEQRGRGVGRRLLVEVLRLAEQMAGLEEIQLIVATHNRGAASLYRRYGFVDAWIEARALKVGNEVVDAHHMALSLRPPSGEVRSLTRAASPSGRRGSHHSQSRAQRSRSYHGARSRPGRGRQKSTSSSRCRSTKPALAMARWALVLSVVVEQMGTSRARSQRSSRSRRMWGARPRPRCSGETITPRSA
jgi:ribosomal protein S18 acetylase RimI-like enzyme